MAVRQPVGIALALAAGVGIGYAASPSAQVVPIVPGSPTPYQAIKLRVEPVDQNRVSVTISANQPLGFVGRQIDISIDPTHLVVSPTMTDGRSLGQVYELPRR